MYKYKVQGYMNSTFHVDCITECLVYYFYPDHLFTCYSLSLDSLLFSFILPGEGLHTNRQQSRSFQMRSMHVIKSTRAIVLLKYWARSSASVKGVEEGRNKRMPGDVGKFQLIPFHHLYQSHFESWDEAELLVLELVVVLEPMPMDAADIQDFWRTPKQLKQLN